MSVHAVFGARFVAVATLISVLALTGCTSSAGAGQGQVAGTAAPGSATVAPATRTDAPVPSAVVPVIAVKPAAPSQVTVDCDAFAAQARQSGAVHLKAGDVVTVTLCSNGSTGFSWEQPRFAGDALGLFGASGVGASDVSAAPLTATPTTGSGVGGTNPATLVEQGPVGSASTTTFVLKANHSGAATVSFSYSRPWAGGEKGVWQYTLQVTID